MKSVNGFKVPEHGLQIEETLAANDKDGVEHLSRYWWAWTVSAIKRPKVTYDLGCGCGYGSYILGEQDYGRVLGIDVDRRGLNMAHGDNSRENINYLEYNLENHWSQHAAFKGNKPELVVCFELLEYVWHRDFFLHQLSNFTADDGIALFSSRAVDRPLCNSGPKDARFHYNGDVLRGVLKRHFEIVTFGADAQNQHSGSDPFGYIDQLNTQIKASVKESYTVGRDLVYCANPKR